MPPEIRLIVASNSDRVIGTNNQLPWHIPEDLAHFKQLTLGKTMIMGRKTFESIGRVLPGRVSAVISRNNYNHSGVESFTSLESAILAHCNEAEICIIGGGEVFAQSMPLATKLSVTWVDVEVANPCAWFPEINFGRWKLVEEKSIISKSGINCRFCEYQLIG